MSDARISLRFLLLGLAMLVGAGAVIHAGVQFDELLLLVSGGVGAVGALAVVGMSVRSHLGIGARPGAAGASVRGKLKHFWAGPASGEEVRPATVEQIAAAERALGVRLPKALVRLLRVQDGGAPRYALWAPAEARAEADCDTYHIDLLHDTERLVSITRELIDDGDLLAGVVCICGYIDDDWQLCLDYREAVGGGEAAVVAFDVENELHRLAESFEAFVANLRRSIRRYVYAPQGVLGKAVDGLLAGLAEALGAQWQAHPRDADAYVMQHPTWKAPSGAPATFELRPNIPVTADGKRAAAAAEFPETWSYRVLHCTIHPRHRPELEQRLSRTEHKWLLVHEPAERILMAEATG